MRLTFYYYLLVVSVSAFSVPGKLLLRHPCPVQILHSHPVEYSDGDNSASRPFRVVVVGGGIGGIATAARIAGANNGGSRDVNVLVLEKNTEANLGGRCGSFDRVVPSIGTFRHERGASLLLLPHIYHELFADCTKNPAVLGSTEPQKSGQQIAEDFGLVMRQCTPAYQVVFDDGDRLDVGFSKRLCEMDEKIAKQFNESKRAMNRLEANASTKWDMYMRATSAFLDCGLPNFIEERLDWASFPRFILEALRDFGKAWPLKPHSDVLDAIFESEKMRALASFQDLYVGLEPYRDNKQQLGGVLTTTAPAVFGLLAAIELHEENEKAGVFAPVGGFRAVAESIANLAKSKGVKIETGKMVTSIESDGVHIRNNDSPKTQAATSNKETYFVEADLIIVNADLPYASQVLVQPSAKGVKSKPGEPRFDWDDSFLYSSGVVAFHWSLSKEMPALNTHNVFLAASKGRSSSEKSWRVLRAPENPSTNGANATSAKDLVEPFNFYVHCPTRTDPTAAPNGCDSIMVLVPCPTLQRKADYASLPRDEAIHRYKAQFGDDYIANLRQAVLHRLAAISSLADLEEHIVDEVVDTPATYADQYHVGAGTPFALSHGFGQLSIMRPGPRFGLAKDSNILYCGAGSRPGNGVPLVLVGSKLVSKKAQAFIEQFCR